MSSYESVIDQMAAVGITGLQAADLYADGKIHRFKADHGRSKSAWYILYETRIKDQTVITGSFGDWTISDKGFTVKLDGIRMSDDDREKLKKDQAKKRREAADKRKALARKSALRAQQVWAKLSEHGESGYLQRKQALGYGVRYSDKGAVAIPMQDMGGVIHGLQIIHKEPRKTRSGDLVEKDFWPYGADPRGHFHLIGQPAASGRVIIGVCEGYATGASIHQAADIPVCVAFNKGNLAPVVQAIVEAYRDADIIIFADDDYLTKTPVDNPGITEAIKVSKKFACRWVAPQFTNRKDQKWTDFNDLHVVEGLDAVKDQVLRTIYGGAEAESSKKKDKPELPSYGPEDEWMYRLGRTQSGNFRADLNNTKLVLQHDPRWRNVLQYNEFDYDIYKINLPPFADKPKTGEWDEVDTERLRCWLADNYGFTPKPTDAIAAVRVVAENEGMHPVRQYLKNLVWDQEPRLDTWMADYLGAEQDEVSRVAGRKFLIGSVARVFSQMGHPVQMDNVLILEGEQGLGKSSVIKILAGQWSADTHFDLGSKDGYQNLRGVWWYELAELDSFNKAESTRAKGFFTAREDYYRPSYAKKAQKFPRQCVFVGTTNQDHYFKDVSGNRRYWPVRCHEINKDALREARDQLWAEAYHYYKQKHPWWLSPDEDEVFKDAQDDRFLSDSWEDMVAEWLMSHARDEVTVTEIMSEALNLKPGEHTPPNQTRVGLIMKHIGWPKKRDLKRTPQRFYVRPDDDKLLVATGTDDPPL